MLVIGITGQPLSGKDTVAEYLAERGFVHISGGEMIREEMTKLSLPTDRASINKFVAKRRQERGAGYLSEEIAESIKGDTVVSGFRNTAGVEIFRKKFGNDFFLIAVEAPLDTRYDRAKARGRIGDDISFEQFKQEEEEERGGSTFFEVDKVISLADYLIVNDGPKEELNTKVDKIIEEIKWKTRIKI